MGKRPNNKKYVKLSAAIADLEKSGITVEEAEYAGIYTVTDASKVRPEFRVCPATVYPYFNIDGTPMMYKDKFGVDQQFLRVRYHPRKSQVKSFKVSKVRRYDQPAASGVFAYLP